MNTIHIAQKQIRLIIHQFRRRLKQRYVSGEQTILNVQRGTNKIKDGLAPISLQAYNPVCCLLT